MLATIEYAALNITFMSKLDDHFFLESKQHTSLLVYEMSLLIITNSIKTSEEEFHQEDTSNLLAVQMICSTRKAERKALINVIRNVAFNPQ